MYAPEKIPYAIDRYTNEVNRLYGVMNKRLADREFLAGDYSIADIAIWPWISRFAWQEIDLANGSASVGAGRATLGTAAPAPPRGAPFTAPDTPPAGSAPS